MITLYCSMADCTNLATHQLPDGDPACEACACTECDGCGEKCLDPHHSSGERNGIGDAAFCCICMAEASALYVRPVDAADMCMPCSRRWASKSRNGAAEIHDF
jgi:hypothetical protein